MLFRAKWLMNPFYATDGGGNGGGAGTSNGAGGAAGNNNGGGTGNEPGAQKSGDGAGNGTGAGDGQKNGTPPAGQVTFASEADFQKKVDELLKERLEREKKKSDEAAKKAADDAAAEAAKKNGEWQKVAEQREKELAEAAKKLADVDPLQKKADKYEKSLKATLEAQRKDLPKHITDLLDNLDPADQLEWLAKNREALGKKNPEGVPPTPPASGTGSKEELEAARKNFEGKTRRMF